MKTRQGRLLSVFVLVVIALGVLAACLTPAPTAPPVIDSQAAGAQEEFKTVMVKGLSDLRGAVTAGGAATFNGAATFAVTPTMPGITINGVAQSGAVRYGKASNVISGTTVAHGVGTTPTMFLARNYGIQATTFTQTLYGGNCGVTSCTIYLSAGAVTTVTAAWIAGR